MRSTPSIPMRAKCGSGRTDRATEQRPWHPTEMGMHTEQLAGRTQQRFFSTRGGRAASPIPTPSRSISTSAPNSTAPIWSRARSISKLRELMSQGYGTIVMKNPGAKHSLAVGILNRLNLDHRRQPRLFRLRADRRAEHPHQGPGRLVLRREHDGRHRGDREECGLDVRRGAARRRPRLQGRRRCPHGIDMKGGTIIVGGDTGAFSGFMMQRGRMVILGDAGKNLGDSMYDGTIYVGGKIARARRRCGARRDDRPRRREWLDRKLKMYDLKAPSGVGTLQQDRRRQAAVELRQSRADRKEAGPLRTRAGAR